MNRPWRRLALVGAASLLVLAGLLAARTAQLESRQPAALPVAALAAGELGHLAEVLAGALRLPTVAGDGPFAADTATFLALHDLLRTSFPRVAAALTWDVVAERSLLLTWAGARPELPAVAFLAHLDVVPAADADSWQHPPFSGDISGGEVWGRGALDDKASLVGVLAAVERLLTTGFVPDRTLLFAFGADEEVAGRGAQALAATIEERGIRLASVLDEGTFIVDGVVPGVTQPVALIGTAEKGYASFELAVEGSGGHSSMPPSPSIAAVLGAALARLDAKPMPAHLRQPTRDMLTTLAPAMSLTNRVLLANLWLSGPAVERVLGGSPEGSASLRTTLVPTMLSGSSAENVLPARASAVVNARILPGDTVDMVTAHLRKAVDDPRVTIRTLRAEEPSAPSPSDAAFFIALAGSVRGVEPAALIAPGLMIGATDSRAYSRLCPEVYKFLPIRLSAADLGRFHGRDERISIRSLEKLTAVYEKLMGVVTGPSS